MELSVLGIAARRQRGRFGLYGAVMDSLESCGVALRDGDVLAVSSKYVANSQGRIIRLAGVAVSPEGGRLSKRYVIRPELAEIIIRESDAILGGMAGFVMASGDGIMAPNAGIDRSNAEDGTAILYPDEPYRAAEELRREIFLRGQVHVGVIFVDSRLMPARVGTTGVAIACAGIEPVADLRAGGDLDGNPLKVTFAAVADSLASVANHRMGEGAESTPVVVVRGSGARLAGRRIMPGEAAVGYGQCVYVRSLGAGL